ncbi:MAG TPA: LCP family protein [Micromonosporaceae bacterium]|nr:LCP family protein [Micromonosporaceae bacterium]
MSGRTPADPGPFGPPDPRTRRSATGANQRISGRARVPGPARDPYDARPAYGGPEGPAGPRRPGGPVRRGVRPRWGRIALVLGAAVLVLALIGAGGLWVYANGINNDLKRTDAFSGLADGRPVKKVEGALNILLVGTDSRDPDAPMDKGGKWRADTVILMHIPSEHDRAYLVSIPRDLYVPIPESASAGCDTGQRRKINAAFAFGGLPLAVRTVECFTDVRIDHVMAIDFAGFKEVTDALGGVDLHVERDITSIHKPYRKFKKGLNHMNGAEALDWIRQRYQFPDGDFARMRHQQEFLRAVLDKAASTGTLTNPAKLNAFLNSVTAAVTVDHDFSLISMGLQFRNLRGENLVFLTSPHKGSQTINGESVVVSDRDKALAMYRSIAADKMPEWARDNVTQARSTGN